MQLMSHAYGFWSPGAMSSFLPPLPWFLVPSPAASKAPFPLVFLCSWFTFKEGKLRLSSMSMAYENSMLVFLAANEDYVFAVEILPFVVGLRCSPRFKRFCSYVGAVTIVSLGTKIL
ncbi:hypothetical protein V6N13_125699 [Hibiscus sabdariffa]|uniref:Uncharacterized protein n=1 Tax=Hibiscus sabdariffa TaxID=183260 RepID=A0ABR2U6E7_9ROSI